MTINCKGQLIDLSSPKIMGILNITPDSFYDGGRYTSMNDILTSVENMLFHGAHFIDIGAYSSRPGAAHIAESEELKRIVPVVKQLVAEFPDIIISVDTFRSTVAKFCVEEGASIINDISASEMDSTMMETAAHLQIPYIMMHMQGLPKTMQNNPTYQHVTKDIRYFFSQKIAAARNVGIRDIVIDPGFGFGKTIHHNYQLLNELDMFAALEVPLLVGISRKSMIYKPLKTGPEEALNGTTALHMIALEKGARILRVHDVKEASQCIKLFNLLKQNKV